MSGSLLSHDALEQMLQRSDPLVDFEQTGWCRRLRTWHAALRAELGPAAGPRMVFDEVAHALVEALGYQVCGLRGADLVTALLARESRPVAALIVTAWGRPLRAVWRDAVHAGLSHDVRWTLCVNGASIGIYDVRRAYARRLAEFDLAASLETSQGRSLLGGLLGAGSLTHGEGGSRFERVLAECEAHRIAVRASLRSGVHEALLYLTGAFRLVVSRRNTDAQLLEESLVVLYRLLFLLFAEARGLVPNWHPVYRDSYTIESVRRQLARAAPATGLWETFQAVSRLAHRGCRAGPLRVAPFNGRLFSPSHAPLAAQVSLDDNVIREAVLALTTTTGEGGRRAISYADLGVEQLGAVYEHLLDFDVETRAHASVRTVPSGRRKATGSFYTPRVLTELVVRRALGPLVEGRSPEQILALRIVDPAMGSGAFLVAACRYLANAYEQALVAEGTLALVDITEQDRAEFRRAVAQRCLFGVDINPMAVQLARLSIWLATLAAGKPLSFLDHRLRAGHSLIGASMDDVMRQPQPGRRSKPRPLPLFAEEELAAAFESAVTVRHALESTPDDSVEQVRHKERSLVSLNQAGGPLERWRAAADLWCAAWLDRGILRDRRTFGVLLDHVLDRGAALPPQAMTPLLAHARGVAARTAVFNWTVEFPEVFHDADGLRRADGGFDVVIGNPPWDVVREDAGLTAFARGSGHYTLQGKGHPNLYQLFFERGWRLLRPGGRCAWVLPSGFATDHGCAALRRHLFEHTTVDTFTTIDNRDRIFPIHRSLKFLLLTCTADGRTSTIPLRSGVRDVTVLDRVPDIDADREALPVPRPLVAAVSGEGLEVPEIRSALDLEILSHVIVRARPAADPDGWNIHFGRELNATDDRPALREDGRGLPIIEGKHLRPFGFDAAPVRFTILPSLASRLLDGERTFARARLAYRDVASPTNRMTLIAAVVPAQTVTTHTVFCIKERLDDHSQHFLCGVMNSYVANYLIRMRVGTHVTTAILGRLPLMRPASGDPVFRAIAGCARGLADRWDATAFVELNTLVARLYELSVRQYTHILETFPLVQLSDRDAAIEHFRAAAWRSHDHGR